MVTAKAAGSLCLFATMVATCTLASCSTGAGGTLSGGASAAGGTSAGGAAATGNLPTSGSTTSIGGRSGISIDLHNTAGNSGVTTEVVTCTEGEDCNCPTLAVAVIGKPGKWGAASNSGTGTDSDTAFQDWLNSSSAGTAKVDNYTLRPTITAEFLAPYNVIILGSLAEDSNLGPFWSFEPLEIAAMRDWVETSGGGVITLSGYAGDPAEIKPNNQLIAYSGISYNADSTYGNASADNTLAWCGGSSPITDWNRTDAVIANLSANLTWVGMQNGRSISAPADAHVAATVTGSDGTTKNVVVGKVCGKGRVLVFSDEWITYTSQWNGAGNPNTTNTACTGHLPQDLYQTAQFWYNMIKWSQPSATCFKIVDKEQPVTLW